MTVRKKLIEVLIPLDAINEASIREKSIRHGHPSTLHLWWARRPLATCRAVLFASLVDDPSAHLEQFPTEQEQEQERQRLFNLIKELVIWENSNDPQVLERAHAEILKSTAGNPPPVLDPFAGGGSIPLEAQRLGLEAHASDLNPVAVLINKALIEIPPKFAGQPPVNPEAKKALTGGDWQGAHGLAEDIRYYGKWMRDEAEKRIGYLYPKVTLPKEYGGGEATVIAWLWARTVKCPNPACGVQMPLVRSFWLSKKKGKETWVEPEVDHTTPPPTIRFSVKGGKGEPPSGTVNRQGAICIACSTPVPFEHIRKEGKAERMSAQLMAIVAEGKGGRVYLSPNEEHIAIAAQSRPEDVPESNLPEQALSFRVQLYGMTKHHRLFSSRQLIALTTLSDLIQEVRDKVLIDTNLMSQSLYTPSIHHDANSYADALATYLAIAIDRLADRNSMICSWDVSRDSTRNTFARQAIPMVWDFAEANPFSDSTGNFLGAIDWIAEVIAEVPCQIPGKAEQRDATVTVNGSKNPVISTDPPYYDNIGYADLSDFFYVWLRRSLSNIYPDLFGTMLVPKAEELIATPYRFGGSKSKAQEFFETGLGKSFERMRAIQHPDYPLTVYYAFKQSESEADGDEEPKGNGNGKSAKVIASTGWETMLEGLIHSGFAITGTWPIRTEMMSRSTGQGTNALASSIVLVCRPRPVDAPIASRRQFLNELRTELPGKLKVLQREGIAPVDLAQASIGPGMEIYSRYSRVIEADGTPLKVRTALQLINRALDAILNEQLGDYDAQTRLALAWFETNAMNEGPYGLAETLSKSTNTTVEALVKSGLLEAKAGKVRLLKREELSQGWKLEAGKTTVWEVMQRMIRALDKDGSRAAGAILRQASEQGEQARDLAYWLYTVCERKGWATEARPYNLLVTSWSEISREAQREISSNTLWTEIY